MFQKTHVIPFLILVIILVIKPTGLFGSQKE